MKTVKNTATRKIKDVELKYTNMTFVVNVHSHYMADLTKPCWSANRYTATIKETGEYIGGVGGKENIKEQMALVNSKPNLFLR